MNISETVESLAANLGIQCATIRRQSEIISAATDEDAYRCIEELFGTGIDISYRKLEVAAAELAVVSAEYRRQLQRIKFMAKSDGTQ